MTPSPPSTSPRRRPRRARRVAGRNRRLATAPGKSAFAKWALALRRRLAAAAVAHRRLGCSTAGHHRRRGASRCYRRRRRQLPYEPLTGRAGRAQMLAQLRRRRRPAPPPLRPEPGRGRRRRPAAGGRAAHGPPSSASPTTSPDGWWCRSGGLGSCCADWRALLARADANRSSSPQLHPRRACFGCGGARVATVHDLTFIACRRRRVPTPRWRSPWSCERTLLTAALLVTPSAAVRDELIDLGGGAGPRAGHPHGPASSRRLAPGAPDGHAACLRPLRRHTRTTQDLPLLLAAWERLRGAGCRGRRHWSSAAVGGGTRATSPPRWRKARGKAG